MTWEQRFGALIVSDASPHNSKKVKRTEQTPMNIGLRESAPRIRPPDWKDSNAT